MDVPGLDDDCEPHSRGRNVRVRLANGFGVVALSATSLTDLLLREWKSKFGQAQYHNNCLLVFPGNGANLVRHYLPAGWLNGCRWKETPTKRIWDPGNQPYVMGGRFTDRPLFRIRHVIIIDDVVSSGATIRQVQLQNEVWLPGADWYAICWLKQASTCTRGFKGVYSGRRDVGTPTSKCSINSLSTLLMDSKIAESYARRNFGDKADEFLRLLGELRKSL